MAALQPILDALKAADTQDVSNADGVDVDLSQLDEASIKAMLDKLDMAGKAADGIEARLDSLLGELDGMLEGLEAVQASPGGPAEETATGEKQATKAEKQQ